MNPLSVRCDVCGSAVNEPCRGTVSREVRTPHLIRCYDASCSAMDVPIEALQADQEGEDLCGVSESDALVDGDIGDMR